MQIQIMEDIEGAKEAAQNYQYALLYFYSDVKLGETKDLAPVNWDECLEARFFDGEKELRFFREGDTFLASLANSEGESIDNEFPLDARFQGQWSKMKVRQFLEYDTDGQAFVAATMLAGLER